MSPQDWPLLLTIESPDDVRRLPAERLAQLARELRLFLIESVSSTGGHLAANLGVIELTVALHYVFDTPADKLVWDVGHQTYAHKILTGRRLAMAGIRQQGGIAGFPKREESVYDAFGTGHSSTSISAALGMVLAMQRNDNPAKAVAIIGDGAMSGGMAFEALNHAGDSDADLLVILNDNDMSISENVGALSNHLTRLLSGQLAYSMRERSKRVLDHLPLPGVREMARRAEEHVKGMVAPGTMFEELGFNYFGPVDGHDIDTLVPVLQNLRDMSGRRFLHVTTRKGKGYFPAENDPRRFHGVGRFETSTGESTDKSPPSQTYTQVFGDWLCGMAEEDARLAGITPAMREGSGLVEFSRKYPDRYFDVGIAEQHAITLAAGMACEGMKPVVAIYSTFLQRGYDQLIHDVALQNLPVLFAIDRAGVVGADGPTHTGAYDISFLRCIPNMVVMTPADAAETRSMLTTGFLHDGPAAVRYPRGKTSGSVDSDALIAVPFGKALTCLEGEDIAILAFGPVLQKLHTIAESLHATLVNMRFVKPLDTELLEALVDRHRLIVTVEDNALAGGAGSAVNEWLLHEGHGCAVMNLGYPDAIVSLGTQDEQLTDWELDEASIRSRIEQRMALL